jgi:hypothetical protein
MLLENDWLRVRFAFDRIATLADLAGRGIELTPEEVDLFVRADPRVWFWSTGKDGDRMH